MMEGIDGFCLDCNHKHRGITQCNYCDCNWESSKEDNMIKKLIKWVWNIICWPFKKAVEWLWTR